MDETALFNKLYLIAYLLCHDGDLQQPERALKIDHECER